jgi:hypothetical protein
MELAELQAQLETQELQVTQETMELAELQAQLETQDLTEILETMVELELLALLEILALLEMQEQQETQELMVELELLVVLETQALPVTVDMMVVVVVVVKVEQERRTMALLEVQEDHMGAHTARVVPGVIYLDMQLVMTLVAAQVVQQEVEPMELMEALDLVRPQVVLETLALLETLA